MTHDSDTKGQEDKPDLSAAAQLVAEADTGGRKPDDGFSRWLLLLVPLAWSLFQLWYASPLPYTLRIGVFNAGEARAIHLAFALILVFTAYPALNSSPRHKIPVQDWLLALLGASCALYLFVFQNALAARPGLPTTLDVVVGIAGVVFLLEAARRSLGLALPIVASLFLVYAFFGPYMPDLLAHRGASIPRAATQYWAFRPHLSSCSCCSALCWKRPARETISSKSLSRCWAISAADQPRPLCSVQVQRG